MKAKLIVLIAVLCLLIFHVHAQPPQKFRYQAIARDASGNPFANTAVKVRAGIRDLTETGTIVYQETQSVTTNSFGLFNLSIGTGVVTSGVFTAINWGTGSKYMEVEIDFGSGYVSMGNSELLSVPYALYAPNVKGDTGAAGSAGSNGNTWYSGTVGPSTGNGVNGDYYLNTTTGDVYLKTGGSWSIVANIIGPAGAAGATGATGIAGTNGNTWYSSTGVPSTGTGVNGDYYLNTTTGDVYLAGADLAKFFRQYYLTSGIVLPVNEKIDFRPSLLAKYVNAAPAMGEIDGTFIFSQKLFLGVGFRTDKRVNIAGADNMLVGIIEFDFSSYLRIGYSYDHYLSQTGAYNSGTHEFMLGWDISRNKTKLSSPRFF